MRAWLDTRDRDWIVLVRLLVGLVVFFPEGIQKLMFPAIMGAGRFTGFGIPWPNFTGPFVGIVEIVCGALITVGLLTRLAAIPLIIDMIVAIVSTKIPMLLGHGFWGFHLVHLSRYGFWSMAHEARTDVDMLLGCIFLLIVGGGRWSMDALWARRVGRPVTHRS
ncbi:MAG: DoxX family protein [Rhodanobacter sp.]|nr:MAG: DoxX family protein [Rhodanobacter sp.]